MTELRRNWRLYCDEIQIFFLEATEPFSMLQFALLLPAFIIYYITMWNVIRYTATSSEKSLCNVVPIILYDFSISVLFWKQKNEGIS